MFVTLDKKERRRRIVKDKNPYTTAFGIPVGEGQNSLTAGERGPILMYMALAKPRGNPIVPREGEAQG